MGLDIGVFCPEKGTGPLPSQVFHHIHPLAAAIIPLPRVALRIFIGKVAPHGLHNGLRNEVFRGDQLDILPLPPQLRRHGLCDFRIRFLNTGKLQHKVFVLLIFLNRLPKRKFPPGEVEGGLPGSAPRFFHPLWAGKPPQKDSIFVL